MVTGPINTEPTEFLPGYKVSFLGAKGEVTSLNHDHWCYSSWPIEVLFESGRVRHFTADGLLDPDLIGARLELLSTDAPKVKKWKWAFAMNDYHHTSEYMSEEEAREFFRNGRIESSIKLTFTEQLMEANYDDRD